jgi:hypothetical protein
MDGEAGISIEVVGIVQHATFLGINIQVSVESVQIFARHHRTTLCGRQEKIMKQVNRSFHFLLHRVISQEPPLPRHGVRIEPSEQRSTEAGG